MNEIEMLKERIASMENDVKVLPRDERSVDSIAGKINAALDDARAIYCRTLAMIGFITGNRPDEDLVPNPDCLEQAVNMTCGMLKGTVENLDVIMRLLGVGV